MKRGATKGWFIVTGALVALALLAAMLVFDQTRRESTAFRARTAAELAGLSSLISADLQFGAYAAAAQAVEEWARRGDDLLSVRVTAANGYPIVVFDRPGARGPTLTVEADVHYSYSSTVSVILVKDLRTLEAMRNRLIAEITGGYLLVVGFVIALMRILLLYRGEARLLRAEMARRQAIEEQHSAAQRRNAQLAALVHHSQEFIGIATLDGRSEFVNEFGRQLVGMGLEENLGGRALADFVHPAARQRFALDIVPAVVAHGHWSGELEFRRLSDDAPIPMLVQAFRIDDVDGRPLWLATVSRDITERKTTEAKLQAQLERLNLLQEITHAIGDRLDIGSVFQVVAGSLESQLALDFACICLYEHADHCLTVACVGTRSLAFAQAVAMPERVRIPIDENGLSRCVKGQLVYEPDTGQVMFPFPQRLAQGGLNSLVVAPLQVESHVFGVLVAARRQANGFTSGECEFLRQLSEHVALAAHQAKLHGALQLAYDDLRNSQQAVIQHERLRALGQMSSGIAHDINNAISPVALYTELLLEEETLSTRARSYLEVIHRAIEDVAQTVARMRDFYQQREPRLTHSPVDLNSLMQQVLDLTRARWRDMQQQRGAEIQTLIELAPDLPAILGQESEIREALVNLVFNAVDAMQDGGTLTLRTTVAQGVPDSPLPAASRRVYAEVLDTGKGMDEETRTRCLEPFFTTKGERGTGLGLAMVYGAMQRHGADIDIGSVIGKGTTVRLGFPAPTLITGAANTPAGYLRPSPRRILVVDDDPLLLKSLIETLETDGHTVFAANGGKAGIDAFVHAQQRGEPFAAVFTDLGMPGIDGRQVAAAVKRHSPSTPVVMLTGWGQKLVDEGDVPSQVDCMLSKPPKLHDLRRALTQCCSRVLDPS